jgi:soluble lytic murein transglycosylase
LAAIWYETPGSPWALEARRAMEKLEGSAAIERRTLSAAAHYDFIKALRSAGLHDQALEEIGLMLTRHPEHRKADGALFMQTMSLHAKRRNEECVATAERLKMDYRDSRWLPAAGIYAIKCLRRADKTPEIRRWAGWIISTYPGHDKSMEAYYNLGGYLGNVVSKEEGLKILRQMVAVGGQHEDVRDALWKIAWLERNRGNTDQAIHNLERLLQEHPDTGYRKAALYWQARFLAPSNRGRATALLQICVEEFPNHYYGHKALDALKALGETPRRIGSLTPFPSFDDLTNPQARPNAPGEYLRAVELKGIGLYELAATELESMPGVEKDLGLQFALAELYSHSGNTWKAAALIKRHFGKLVDSGSRDPNLVPARFWRVVYPFNYRPEIDQALQETGLRDTGIDPYLTAALIRSESRFFPNAISSAGAIGLMQLMPDLARQIARQRWQRDLNRSELFDPRTNIRLGTYHLAKLIEGFGGDWAPAICSYNAGVTAARRWWAQKPAEQPLVEFIENIPYLETRLYIKQILADHRNYEWIYGQGR